MSIAQMFDGQKRFSLIAFDQMSVGQISDRENDYWLNFG
jgi:hypothetical protein